MPTLYSGHSPEFYKTKARRREKFAAKARARGIMEGSTSWRRYMRAHGC